VGLYVLSILVLGLSVSQHSPDLLDAVDAGGETAASSPFVVLCRQVNVKVLPDIINAVVLTSAFSSANENAYAVARFTMAMARQGWLPRRVFLYTVHGVPLAGALFASAMGCLAFMSCSEGSNQVFLWFSNLDALSAMVLWILICAAYTRFYRALKVQGESRRD
jgi:amino acid transporter